MEVKGRAAGRRHKLRTDSHKGGTAVCVTVDIREQSPFSFERPRYEGLTVEVGTLAFGGYSLVGLTDKVAVECKSRPDLVACLGRKRALVATRSSAGCLRRGRGSNLVGSSGREVPQQDIAALGLPERAGLRRRGVQNRGNSCRYPTVLHEMEGMACGSVPFPFPSQYWTRKAPSPPIFYGTKHMEVQEITANIPALHFWT